MNKYIKMKQWWSHAFGTNYCCPVIHNKPNESEYLGVVPIWLEMYNEKVHMHEYVGGSIEK